MDFDGSLALVLKLDLLLHVTDLPCHHRLSSSSSHRLEVLAYRLATATFISSCCIHPLEELSSWYSAIPWSIFATNYTCSTSHFQTFCFNCSYINVVSADFELPLVILATLKIIWFDRIRHDSKLMLTQSWACGEEFTSVTVRKAGEWLGFLNAETKAARQHSPLFNGSHSHARTVFKDWNFLLYGVVQCVGSICWPEHGFLQPEKFYRVLTSHIPCFFLLSVGTRMHTINDHACEVKKALPRDDQSLMSSARGRGELVQTFY